MAQEKYCPNVRSMGLFLWRIRNQNIYPSPSRFVGPQVQSPPIDLNEWMNEKLKLHSNWQRGSDQITFDDTLCRTRSGPFVPWEVLIWWWWVGKIRVVPVTGQREDASEAADCYCREICDVKKSKYASSEQWVVAQRNILRRDSNADKRSKDLRLPR